MTVQVNESVTDPALGILGTMAPPADCRAVTSAAPVWVGHDAPPAALQLAVVQLRPAAAGSRMMALLTESGPLLEATMV